MKPGPRRPKTKFLPSDVINEIVTSSEQYLSSILQDVDALSSQETDTEKLKKLKNIRENIIKQRANFRILSKQISVDVDYIFGSDSGVVIDYQNPFLIMPNKLVAHFTEELQGWSLHVERPEMFHLAHVNFKHTNRRFLVDCVVTLIQRPAQPETIFVSVVYLNDENEKQVSKPQKITLSQNDLSITLLPLLKYFESKRFVLDNIHSKKNELPHIQDTHIKMETTDVSENQYDTKRIRTSRFSEGFLREVLGDTDIEDEEMEKALTRVKEAEERDDETFTLEKERLITEDDEAKEDKNDLHIGSCRLCQEDLTIKQSLDHIRLYHKEKINEYYKCPVCGKTVASMLYHVKTYHTATLHCDVCLKSFTTKTGLKTHRMLAHFQGDLKFKCDLCAKRFLTKLSLEGHVRMIHMKQKRHVCYICGVRFRAAVQLKVHLTNVHQLFEKEFDCHFCGKKFATAKYLTDHLYMHGENRDYKCDICSKSFKTTKGLTQHKVSHKPPKHMCKFCGKMFLYPQGMRTHVKNVHLIIPKTD